MSGSDGRTNNMRIWSKSDTRSEWTEGNITSKELKAHTERVKVVRADHGLEEEMFSGEWNGRLVVWKKTDDNNNGEKEWKVD